MLVGLLLACSVTIEGEVRASDGAPVAGATVTAPDCQAVTRGDGRFAVNCPRGAHAFRVAHPEHLPGTLHVDAGGLRAPSAVVGELHAIPEAPGLYLLGEEGLAPLARAPLRRTASATEQRWCLPEDAAPARVAAGRVRLYDVHAVDWRVLRVDEQGCAWRMAKGGGDFWSYAAAPVDVAGTEEHAPGRVWVDLELPAGRYAIVEWYADFLVRDDVAADTWRAWGIEAG